MELGLKKKFIDLIESMFRDLTADSDQDLDALLKPLRVYINDIDRFSSTKVIDSKFRAFLKTRDDHMLSGARKPLAGEAAGETHKSINQMLDQILSLLELGVHSSQDLAVDLKQVIEKVYKVKSINNARALSDSVINLGKEMINRHEEFHSGLSGLAMELAFCKNQILELEGQLEASRQEADLDHLTELRNRRVFERDLESSVTQAERFRGDLCLLLIDIDGFAKINEEMSHDAGDDVLVNFAGLMNRSLRDYDLCYRLGGDCFVVLFTGFPVTKALSVARRVQKFLSAQPYKLQEKEFTVTISAGFVAFRQGESAKDFMARGMAELARAKSGGRNRVCTDQD